MAPFYKLLEPVSNDDAIAYYLADVLKIMSPAHKEKLHAWLNGRVTLILIGEQEAIFKYDLEKFFDTL